MTLEKRRSLVKPGCTELSTDRSIKGLGWKLLRNPGDLDKASRADLDAITAQVATKRTARAWLYKEQMREFHSRKQTNVVRALLDLCYTNVMRSKVEPIKAVAAMVRSHVEGIVAWARTRQTNGFLEAINGLSQAAKPRARGNSNFDTIRTVIFLMAGKHDFSSIKPHCR